MATQVQRRRGTTAQYNIGSPNGFKGADGELTVDTDLHTVRVHDGVTPGGYPLIVKDANVSLPDVGSWKTKVKYDSQGLVTDATTLAGSDIPDISDTYATQAQLGTKVTANAAITGGTYTKVTVDNKGLVTGGAALAAADIPDISDTYARKLPIVVPTVASGIWALQNNAINVINLTANATFNPPLSSQIDHTILNQIVVQLKMIDAQQINLGTTYYMGGVAPDLSQAGTYNIYYEFDENESAWCVGAILKKAIIE